MNSIIYSEYSTYLYLDSITFENNFFFELGHNATRGLLIDTKTFIGDIEIQNCVIKNHQGYGNSYTDSLGMSSLPSLHYK